MTVIDLVKKRLELPTESALAKLCDVNRSCVWEWRERLAGGIPSRHWGTLIDEAKRLRKSLTLDELRGQ